MSVFLITGAARGIGLGLVRQLSSDASTIVIATIRSTSPDLQTLREECSNIRIVTCDIASVDSILALTTSLSTVLPEGKKITHLINNAGIVAHREAQATSLTTDAITENINTNVLGPAKVAEVTLPFLAQNAKIINITSGMGSLQLLSDGTIPASATAYSVSKAALNMLTVHQAIELKGLYRVVCIDPGHVKTRLGGDSAIVEIQESAGGIIEVVKGLDNDEKKDQENGRARFFSFRGQEIPW